MTRLVILVGASVHEEQVMKLLLERESKLRDAGVVLSDQARAMDSMIEAMEKVHRSFTEIAIKCYEAEIPKMLRAHKPEDPWRRQGKRRAGRPR